MNASNKIPADELARLVLCAEEHQELRDLLDSLFHWRKAYEKTWNRQDGLETDAADLVCDDAIRLRDASEARETDDRSRVA